MFGLTFEKLFIVAVFAALLVGPARLPAYARQLADLVRAARQLAENSRTTLSDDMGLPLDRTAWTALDPRQYDPRHIVRRAWDEPASTAAVTYDQQVWQQAATIRPGQQYLVTGSAAHPLRVRLTSLPAEDPRRLAARAPAEEDTQLGTNPQVASP